MRIGIPGDHRAILNDERLFRLLKHFLKVGDPDPFYNPVLDYVVVPRWNLEVELELDAEERSETWQLIVSEDGKQHEHSVTAITPGSQNKSLCSIRSTLFNLETLKKRASLSLSLSHKVCTKERINVASFICSLILVFLAAVERSFSKIKTNI